MRPIRNLLAAAAVMCASPFASAGPLVPGTTHTPPRFIDESQTVLALHLSHASTHGYVVRLNTVLVGHSGRSSDTLRLDWLSGGAALASAKCSMNGTHVSCESDPDHGLHARGPIVARLVYEDDQDSKSYLIREFKVNVAQWTSFGDEVWQIVGDDLLGSGYSRLLPDNMSSGIDHKVAFVFWSTAADRSYPWGLRCTVNGAAIPDVGASGSSGAGYLEADQVTRGTGAHTLYRWTQFVVVADMHWGAKDTQHTGSPWMIDHVGDWVCNLRENAQNMRELRFHVNAQGLIDSDPMAAGGPPLANGTALIDLRISNTPGFETRLRPDAIRATRGYGLAWSTHPNAVAIKASLPPASGLADPH